MSMLQLQRVERVIQRHVHHKKGGAPDPCCIAAGVPGRDVGQWDGVDLHQDASGLVAVFWRQVQPHPLSAYKGRRIAKMSLMPHQSGYVLALTLAPPSPQQQQQQRRMLRSLSQ